MDQLQKDQRVAEAFTSKAGEVPSVNPLPVADLNQAVPQQQEQVEQQPVEQEEPAFDMEAFKASVDNNREARLQQQEDAELDFEAFKESVDETYERRYDLDNMATEQPQVLQAWRTYRGLGEGVSDEDVLDDYTDVMRGMDNDISISLYHLYQVQKGDLTPEQRDGLRQGLEHWEKVPWGTQGWRGFGESLYHAVFSVETLASMGVGKIATRLAGVGARAALKELVIGGATEGVLGVANSVAKQNVEKSVDARDEISGTEAVIEGGAAAVLSMFPGLASSVYRTVRKSKGKDALVEDAAEEVAKEAAGETVDTPEAKASVTPADSDVKAENEVAKDIMRTGTVDETAPMADMELTEYIDQQVMKSDDAEIRALMEEEKRINSINHERLGSPIRLEEEEDVVVAYMRSVNDKGPVNEAPINFDSHREAYKKFGGEKIFKQQEAELRQRAKEGNQLALSDRALYALRVDTINSVAMFESLAKKVEAMRKAGDDKSNAVLFNSMVAKRNLAFIKKEKLISRTQQSADNAGRLLSAFRMMAGVGIDADIAVEDLARILGKDIETTSKLVAKGRTTEDAMANKAARILQRATDVFMELFYNGILGSLATSYVNTAGGLYANMVRAGGEGLVSGAIGEVRQRLHKAGILKDSANESFGTFRARLEGMNEGRNDAMKLAKYFAMYTNPREKILSDIQSARLRGDDAAVKALEQDYQMVRDVGSSDLRDAATQTAAIPGAVGAVVRMPGKLMGATDAFNKHIARSGAIAAAAERKAMKNGLERGTPEYDEFIAHAKLNPSKEIKQEARREMEEVTFQNPNVISAGIEKLQNVPGFGPVFRTLFMPFARTPVNLVWYGIQRSPLGVILNRDSTLEERAGRVIVGSAVTAMGAYMYENGLITGVEPGDYKKKMLQEQAGVSETALFGVLPISRMDPFAWQWGLGIAGSDVRKAIVEYVDVRDQKDVMDTFNDVFAEIMKHAQHLVVDRTFFSGLGEMVSIYERSQNDGFMLGDELERAGGRALAGVVPGYIKDIAVSQDPYRRRAATISEQLMKRIPFLSTTLPEQVDKFGFPIEQDNKLPIDIVPAHSSPTPSPYQDKARFLTRLGFGIVPSPREVNGVKLTSEMRTFWEYSQGAAFRQQFDKSWEMLKARQAKGPAGDSKNMRDIKQMESMAKKVAEAALYNDLIVAATNGNKQAQKMALQLSDNIKRAQEDKLLPPDVFYLSEDGWKIKDIGNLKGMADTADKAREQLDKVK